MNRLQPIASVSGTSFLTRLSRAWEYMRRAFSGWFQPESPESLSAAARESVVICYHCRRRVSAAEIRAGLHDHPKASAAGAGQHAQEQ